MTLASCHDDVLAVLGCIPDYLVDLIDKRTCTVTDLTVLLLKYPLLFRCNTMSSDNDQRSFGNVSGLIVDLKSCTGEILNDQFVMNYLT